MPLPATGVWNGFLNQINVIECINLAANPAGLAIEVRNSANEAVTAGRIDLSPHGASHFLLDATGVVESYGTYVLSLAAGQATAAVDCRTVIYRHAAPGAGKDLEYVLSIPVQQPLHGISWGLFNSINPQASASLPVFNWLSVFNPGSEPFSGYVGVYNLDGTVNEEKSFPIAGLPPGGRLDFPLGHEEGQTAGTYVVVPDDLAQPYGAFLTRYSRSSENVFNFSFVLEAKPGTNDSGSVPASTMGPAINWAEVANISSLDVTAQIEVYSRDQTLLFSDTPVIAAHGQHHIYLNEHLGESNVGYFRVRCISDSCPPDSLLVESAFYGRRPDYSQTIEWAYASQAGGAPGILPLALPVNTFLGAANWLKLFNLTSADIPLHLRLFAQDGNEISVADSHPVLRGSLDIALHEEVGQDFIGSVQVSREDGGAFPGFTAEVLRVYPAQGSAAAAGEAKTAAAPGIGTIGRIELLQQEFRSSAKSFSEERAACEKLLPTAGCWDCSRRAYERCLAAVEERERSCADPANAGDRGCPLVASTPAPPAPTEEPSSAPICEDVTNGYGGTQTDDGPLCCSGQEVSDESGCCKLPAEQLGIKGLLSSPQEEPATCKRCRRASGCCICHWMKLGECDIINTMNENDPRFPSDYPDFIRRQYKYRPSSDDNSMPKTKEQACNQILYYGQPGQCEWTNGVCLSRFQNMCDRVAEEWKKDPLCKVVHTNYENEDVQAFLKNNNCLANPGLTYVRKGHGRGVEGATAPLNVCVECASADNPDCLIISTEYGCATVSDSEALMAWAEKIQQRMKEKGLRGPILLKADQVSNVGNFFKPVWIWIYSDQPIGVEYTSCGDIEGQGCSQSEPIRCNEPDGVWSQLKCCPNKFPVDSSGMEYVKVASLNNPCPRPWQCPDDRYNAANEQVSELENSCTCDSAKKLTTYAFNHRMKAKQLWCESHGGSFIRYGRKEKPDCTIENDSIYHHIVEQTSCCMPKWKELPAAPDPYKRTGICAVQFGASWSEVWAADSWQAQQFSGNIAQSSCEKARAEGLQAFESSYKVRRDDCEKQDGIFTLYDMQEPPDCFCSKNDKKCLEYRWRINGHAQCCKTPTPSPTPTASPSVSASPTPTSTVSPVPSGSPTATATPSLSPSPSPSPTLTPSPSPSFTPSSSPTPSLMPTPTIPTQPTASPSPTPPAPSPTPSRPAASPSPTPSQSTPAPTPTPTPTSTSTPAPTATPMESQPPSPTPVYTPPPALSPTPPPGTATPSPSASPSPTPSLTPVRTPSPEPSPTPSSSMMTPNDTPSPT